MANEIKVSEEKLRELLDEVEEELSKSFQTEVGKLSKAAPLDEDPSASPAGSPPPASPDASASVGPDASPAPDASASPPPPAAEGSAESPEASGAAPGEAPGEMPPGAPGEGAPGEDAQPSMDELVQAYSQLDPESLKMHYMAVKAALFQSMGAGDGAPDASAPPAGAPPAGGPPAASPPASAPPEMGKAEGVLDAVAPSKAGAGKDRLAPVAPSKAGAGEDRLAAVAVGKKEKETELESLKKSQAEMETALGSLVGAVRTMLETPQRKAVTSAAEMAFVPRTEAPAKTLSKTEILSKLNEKAKTPGLKKSDRELINQFCVGAVDAKDIAHLLTE